MILDFDVNVNVIVNLKGGNMLYKIGDFAKKLNVSVRTLRYYDEINLFKPIKLDLFTNYRYYSGQQIKEFEILKFLQEAGFSLEEIKKYKNNFTDEVMLQKKTEILNEIALLKEKVKKVDYLRGHIKNGTILSGPIKEKNIKVLRRWLYVKRKHKFINR